MLIQGGKEVVRDRSLLHYDVIIVDAHGANKRVDFKEITTNIAYLLDEAGHVYILPTFIELEVGIEEDGEKLYDFYSLSLILSSLKNHQTFFVKGNDGSDVILSLTKQETNAKVIWPAKPTSFREGNLTIYHTKPN